MAGDEPDPKSCCGVTVSQTVSIRWFIVMIAFVGICCSIVGTVLGAMKASGREHLTVSLLMIGKDSHKAFKIVATFVCKKVHKIGLYGVKWP